MASVAESLPLAASRPRAPARWPFLAMAAPALILFLLFFIVPFAVMALMSFMTGIPLANPNASFTMRHYLRMTRDDYYVGVMFGTLRIGLIVTVIALLIAYPLAHLLARMRSKLGRTLLLMAIIAPMLTGLVVRTFAWLAILSNRGVVNSTFQLMGLTSAPLPLLENETGIIIGLVHIYVPFMILTLTGVIARIDPRLEEAARGLGAGRVRTFLEVTLPLSMPGIFAGSLLVFALAISAYVTPLVLGGAQVMVWPILVYQAVSGSFNLGFGGALGVVLLLVSLLLVIAYNKAMGRLAGLQGLR
jgi:putative spermidine/putrescine transport system permease protein